LRNRIRTRLTYANVVATIALFLVVSGGTALGVTYVVSSNSQIGPGTVSGHKPPTGKHSNIITGSVNGTDLSANSVNSSKVTNGSLLGSDIHANTITGSNINLTSVAGALQVRTAFDAASPGDPPDPFFTNGPWTLNGTCVDDGGGSLHAKVELSSGPLEAVASVDDANGDRFTGTDPAAVAQTTTALSGNTAVKGGHFSAWAIGFTNQLSGHVLAVADGVPADFGGAGPGCVFTFEGLGS
jgi:hypothetical protein